MTDSFLRQMFAKVPFYFAARYAAPPSLAKIGRVFMAEAVEVERG
jgi:hypothetical protein